MACGCAALRGAARARTPRARARAAAERPRLPSERFPAGRYAPDFELGAPGEQQRPHQTVITYTQRASKTGAGWSEADQDACVLHFAAGDAGVDADVLRERLAKLAALLPGARLDSPGSISALGAPLAVELLKDVNGVAARIVRLREVLRGGVDIGEVVRAEPRLLLPEGTCAAAAAAEVLYAALPEDSAAFVVSCQPRALALAPGELAGVAAGVARLLGLDSEEDAWRAIARRPDYILQLEPTGRTDGV